MCCECITFLFLHLFSSKIGTSLLSKEQNRRSRSVYQTCRQPNWLCFRRCCFKFIFATFYRRPSREAGRWAFKQLHYLPCEQNIWPLLNFSPFRLADGIFWRGFVFFSCSFNPPDHILWEINLRSHVINSLADLNSPTSRKT